MYDHEWDTVYCHQYGCLNYFHLYTKPFLKQFEYTYLFVHDILSLRKTCSILNNTITNMSAYSPSWENNRVL